MENTEKSVEQNLCCIIQAISFSEKFVEKARMYLGNVLEFNPKIAFEYIDFDKIGSITVPELHGFLNSRNVECSEEECAYIVKHNGSLNTGIPYTNFLKLLLPKTNMSLNGACLRKIQINSQNTQSLEDLEINLQSIADFFLAELEYVRETEAVKYIMYEKFPINVDRVIELIDQQKRGYVDFDTVNKFLKRKHFSYTRDDFKAFIRRYDEDGNGYISRKELSLILQLDKDMYKGTKPVQKLSQRDFNKPNFYDTINIQERYYREYLDNPNNENALPSYHYTPFEANDQFWSKYFVSYKLNHLNRSGANTTSNNQYQLLINSDKQPQKQYDLPLSRPNNPNRYRDTDHYFQDFYNVLGGTKSQKNNQFNITDKQPDYAEAVHPVKVYRNYEVEQVDNEY